MKKNVIVFGLILGAILCVHGYFMVNMFYTNPDFESNDVLGYAVFVVIFSLVFFGIRNYRNKQLGGFISFVKALKTGFLIALVGSFMYAAVWLFYYYLFVPDFLEKYIQYVLKRTSPAQLAAKTKEMNEYREMYKNTFFVFFTTVLEVFPIGLVVALVSALVLKRKKKINEA